MKKIFIFYIGDKSKLKSLLDSIPKKYTVEVGPTEKEHKSFMETPYYKESYEQGIWSFCSDVYRFHKLSTNKGLYIDTSVLIGKNFDEFYDFVSQYKTWIFRLNDLYLNVPIIYGDKSPFFKKCLNVMRLYPKNFGIRNWTTGPGAATVVAHNYGMMKDNDFETKIINNVYIGNVLDVRNKNTIYKIGGGSWFKGGFKWFNKIAAKNGWKKFEKQFINKVSQDKNEAAYKKVLMVAKKVKEAN